MCAGMAGDASGQCCRRRKHGALHIADPTYNPSVIIVFSTMSEAATLLREARYAAGLTQAALAERLDVSQAAIAKLERQGANPTVDTLDNVLCATGHRLELRAAPARRLDADESPLD
jgi:DNA-binding XRE family transcriptional regulator